MTGLLLILLPALSLTGLGFSATVIRFWLALALLIAWLMMIRPDRVGASINQAEADQEIFTWRGQDERSKQSPERRGHERRKRSRHMVVMMNVRGLTRDDSHMRRRDE